MTSSVYFQIVTMECYQLSRLYYCFSRSQVHSDKGYPKCLFITMFLILVFWALIDTVVNWSWLTTKCWIQSDGTAVFEGINWLPWSTTWSYRVWFVAAAVYGSLEFTTMFLYWSKIRSLRKYQNAKHREVYERIQSILHRVLILTYFYLLVISGLIILCFGFVSVVGSADAHYFAVSSLAVTYTMFLMQEHNTKEYIAFLGVINWCFLCFCCFGSMLREQYRMLVENVDTRTFEMKKSIQTANIRNISAGVEYGNKKTGMELSVATKTICDVSYVLMEDNKVNAKATQC